MHVAQRFERLLDAYRRPDGSHWTGQQLDEATREIIREALSLPEREKRIVLGVIRQFGGGGSPPSG